MLRRARGGDFDWALHEVDCSCLTHLITRPCPSLYSRVRHSFSASYIHPASHATSNNPAYTASTLSQVAVTHAHPLFFCRLTHSTHTAATPSRSHSALAHANAVSSLACRAYPTNTPVREGRSLACHIAACARAPTLPRQGRHHRCSQRRPFYTVPSPTREEEEEGDPPRPNYDPALLRALRCRSCSKLPIRWPCWRSTLRQGAVFPLRARHEQAQMRRSL